MQTATFAAHGAALKQLLVVATQPGMDWAGFAEAVERNRRPAPTGQNEYQAKRDQVAGDLAVGSARAMAAFVAEVARVRAEAGSTLPDPPC